MSRTWVVDASVTAQLLVDQPLTRSAAALFARLTVAEPDALWAPDVMLAECANVLWKYVRFHGLGPAVAREGLADLLDLDIGLASTEASLSLAFDLAVEIGMSVYDASYVALAMLLGCPLVTADQRLVAQARAAGVAVVALEDLRGHLADEDLSGAQPLEAE